VEVGAFDGVTNDRLHTHVREGSWHGVLVEPQPRYFARLTENYEGLDGLTFINAAIDRARGVRALYGFEDGRGRPIDSLGVSPHSRRSYATGSGRICTAPSRVSGLLPRPSAA
jgi:hypothetical protein